MNETFAFQLACLYKSFLAFSTRELKQIGISHGQLPFILYVGKHPNCTQAELTNRMHMDWGHSQRTIAKLAENGFLIKSTLEGDTRNYHLILTEKGQQAFHLSHRVFHSWDEQHLNVLTPEEQDQLFALIRKLTSGGEIR